MYPGADRVSEIVKQLIKTHLSAFPMHKNVLDIGPEYMVPLKKLATTIFKSERAEHLRQCERMSERPGPEMPDDDWNVIPRMMEVVGW